jgi:hypothetical protein
MPRKKNTAVEMISPDLKAKPTKEQIVTARHTVVYDAPEVVQVPAEDEDEDMPEAEAPEPEQQRQPSFRTKLRERFKQRGIGVDETLNLRIDRLPLFQQNGLAGVKTDKEFCGIVPCTEKFFDSDEYLIEIQRRYGPGEYWLTVRHKNIIISQWRERVGGFPVAPAAVVTEPGQPPQMVYGQPPPIQQSRTFKEELRDMADMIKLVDGIRGPREENPPPTQSQDPDAILISSLASNDKFMDKISHGLVGKLIGRNGGDDDPSPWAVAMEVVKSGQAAQIVKTVVDSFFNGVRGFIPNGGNQHGQAQMAQAPLQNHGPAQQNQSTGQAAPLSQVQGIETQPHGSASMVQANPPTNPQMTPADQALSVVIGDCARKIPPQVTFTNLMTFADAVNDQAPAYSIDGWITFFGNMAVDDAIDFVKTLPNGEQVISLPHARGWTEQLQKLIRESEDGEE